MTRTVAVLGYHRVGPSSAGSWETWFSVPAGTFAEHLRVLDEGLGGWMAKGYPVAGTETGQPPEH